VEGVIFRTCPDRPWGPLSLLYSGYRVSFPGLKRPRRGVDYPSPTSFEVKERVELFLYSPSWSVLGWTLPYLYLYLCESWAFCSDVQCLDHFEPWIWGHNVGICSTSDALSFRSRSESSKVWWYQSLLVNKDGWSMKQTTLLPFIAVQRTTTSTFFISL